MNAYRKCRETGYRPKKTFNQRIEEQGHMNREIKLKKIVSKRNKERNSLMMNPMKFHSQKFSAIRKRTLRESKILQKKETTKRITNFEAKKLKINNILKL